MAAPDGALVSVYLAKQATAAVSNLPSGKTAGSLLTSITLDTSLLCLPYDKDHKLHADDSGVEPECDQMPLT